MELFDLIQSYGDFFYAIVAAWTFFEGETIVLIAGVASREGMLDFPSLILCAWVGSFLGDQLYFTIGRKFGGKLLNRLPRLRPRVHSALGLLERYSTLFILSFRFVYGVRNVSSFSMGMSGISWSRFALLNFVAAGLWAVSFASGGYLAGAALQHVLGSISEGISLGLLALAVVAGLTVFLVRRLRRRSAA